MDVGTLVAAIEGIKQATTIAKMLAASESTLEKAELKLKIADIVVALAAAREGLADASEAIKTREVEITRLKDALILKGRLQRRGDAYFEVNGLGAVFGDAICSYCWEQHHRLIHLTTSAANFRDRICPHCKHAVNWSRIKWPPESDGGEDCGPGITVGRVIRG